MLEIIKGILRQILNDLDSGNSNISENEQQQLLDLFSKINKKELCATEASDYIGVSKSTFYNYINKGILPKGQKYSGKGVLWNKSDLDKYLEQQST